MWIGEDLKAWLPELFTSLVWAVCVYENFQATAEGVPGWACMHFVAVEYPLISNGTMSFAKHERGDARSNSICFL